MICYKRELEYSSPEVLSAGPVKINEETELSTLAPSSPKVDVWSLGCILLEVLAVRDRTKLELFYHYS